MGLEASIGLVLRLLETAAEYDTATGGTDRRAAIFPTVKTISRQGIRDIPTDEIARIYGEQVEAEPAPGDGPSPPSGGTPDP